MPSDSVEAPVLRVVRGSPTDEEIAAATAALVSMARNTDSVRSESHTDRPGWVSTSEYRPPGAWTSG